MGVEIYDKPSGVVRGECRGGLGGAAAPNRPPSAPAGGGPNKRKRKAPTPAGCKGRLSKDKPALFSSERPPRIPRRTGPTHTKRPAFSNAGLLNSDRQTN